MSSALLMLPFVVIKYMRNAKLYLLLEYLQLKIHNEVLIKGKKRQYNKTYW